MSRSLLLVGDLHLGRRPAGFEDALATLGIDPHELSAAAAWRRTVEQAIARDVRAVVLAGDVVEGERDRFEAFAALEAGVRRLVGAGIEVIAVAGNHDGEVLPRLAERLPELVLLGRGGRWERHQVAGPGPRLDLVGWSFPGRTCAADPTEDPGLAAALAARREGAYLVGVVHGDLDATGSAYAPISRQRLEATSADAWLLGHLHRPDRLAGERPIGYLGSLTGLDPGEPGVHGPWLLELGSRLRLEQLALAPVRFESLEVPLAVEQAIDDDAVIAAVATSIRERFAEALGEELLVLAARVRVTGRLERRDGVRAAVAGHRPEHAFQVGPTWCVVTRLEDATRPAFALAELATEASPAGCVADWLLALEHQGPPSELTTRAAELVGRWSGGVWELGPDWPPPGPEEVLAEALWRALDALLEQRLEGRR